MSSYPPTIIIRHRKENIKKCSLRGLEVREDMLFFKYPLIKEPLLKIPYFLLDLDGPILTDKDRDKGILLLDGTWRYAQKMAENIPFLSKVETRSLPKHFQSAYPRRQTLCPDPQRGLASIEALYFAYIILQRPTQGLLINYNFQADFLLKNGL